MNVLEILTEARAHIATGWCVNYYALDRNGAVTDYDGPEAARWCALGAVGAAAKDYPYSTACDEVTSCIAEEITDAEVLPHEWSCAAGKVAAFNNKHTQVEVLAKFDAAIAKLTPEKARELDPAFVRLKAELKFERDCVPA